MSKPTSREDPDQPRHQLSQVSFRCLHEKRLGPQLCPSHTHTYVLLRRVPDQTAVVRRKMRAGPNFLMRLQDAHTFNYG